MNDTLCFVDFLVFFSLFVLSCFALFLFLCNRPFFPQVTSVSSFITYFFYFFFVLIIWLFFDVLMDVVRVVLFGLPDTDWGHRKITVEKRQ
jgi:hypothetical protein